MIETIIQCVRGFLGDISKFWDIKKEKLLKQDRNTVNELCFMEKVQMLEVSDFLDVPIFKNIE